MQMVSSVAAKPREDLAGGILKDIDENDATDDQ